MDGLIEKSRKISITRILLYNSNKLCLIEIKGPQNLEAQLSSTKNFHSCNHQKLLPYQILGGKTEKNVQVDPQQRKYGRNS